MKTKLLVAALCVAFASPAYCGEWRVGPGIAVATGLNDVTKVYEDNYNNTHTTTQVDIKAVLPFSIAAQATYTWNSGVRADLGLGPLFRIHDNGDGDVDTGLSHTEVPISATVGYTFIPHGMVSPYVRAGLSHHFASGDYVVSSSPGLFGAMGVEFMRTRVASVSFELAFDQAKVELDRYQRDSLGVISHTAEKMKTYDTVIALYVKF